MTATAATRMRGPTLRRLAEVLLETRGEEIYLGTFRERMRTHPVFATYTEASRKSILQRALRPLYEAGFIDVARNVAPRCYFAEHMAWISSLTEDEYVAWAIASSPSAEDPDARGRLEAEARREHGAARTAHASGKWADLRAFAPTLQVSFIR